MVSSINIEEPSDAEDILCATMVIAHVEVNDAFVNIHAHDM